MKLFLFAALAGFAFAQKFEVASIKPNHSTENRIGFGMRPGGRFSATGVNLRQLMTFAYNIREYQITGLPAWAGSDRYDIDAKPEGPEEAANPNSMPTQAEMQTRAEKTRAMLQGLLADRFGLKMHRETKEAPVYNLVVAKTGSKLVESRPDAPDVVEGASNGRGRGDDVVRGPRAQMMRMGRGQIAAQQVPITFVANNLSGILGRNVIDKTGLSGSYDIKLSWTPEDAQAPLRDGAPEPANSDAGPSIFTAIQEQLGLKLEPSKGPVELIVVDHVEKPTEN